MIFNLELDNAPVPERMYEEALYLQRCTVFGRTYVGNQRLVVCFSVIGDYALVRDMDSWKVTAVNDSDLEGYVLVTESLAGDLLGTVLEEKDKRLKAFQRASQMMDELEAV